MNNEQIYERLSSLYDKLNIDHPAGSQENAQLKAFSSGISFLQEQFDEYFKQIFPDTAEGLGLAYYCELLDVDYSLEEQERRDEIIYRLSEDYRKLDCSLLKEQIEGVGEGFSYSCNNFAITIDGSISGKEYLLKKINSIIERFISPFTVVNFAGDGADFDYWDSLDYFFEDYDSLGLRFELLDTLKL